MLYGPSGGLATYVEEQTKRGRQTDARTVKRVIQAFRPYRFQVALVLTAILLTTLLGLVNPFLIVRIFDDALPKGNATLLLIYAAIMFATPILSGIIGVGQAYLNNKVGQSVMHDFRKQLYQHLQSMPLDFFTGTRTGEIQSRLSNDIGGVQGVVTTTATNLVSNISVVVGIIIAMIILSPLLTAISLALLPLFLWITYKVGNIRRQTSKETQKSMASLTALMQETLSVSGILLVKVFGRQQYALAQFNQESKTLANLAVRQLMIGRWFFMLTGTFFAAMPALIYLIAGQQIIHHAPVLGGTMTLGTMVAFTTLQSRLFLPAGQLLSMQVDIRGALALFDRIFEYLDVPIEIQDKPDALRLKPEMVRGEVTFRNVTFSYKHDVYSVLHGLNQEDKQDKSKTKRTVPPEVSLSSGDYEGLSLPSGDRKGPSGDRKGTPLLKNVSFTIKPGQLAALVGPSEAGKTMITYLVPRLYDVEDGAVEIDGHNVKDVTQASLVESIGVVTQETSLFHASIQENLLYARPDATEEEMIAAAQAAAIHDRIMELEDGYDTIVGERGYKLSGDEKQRVTIARAILKNPRILILDEATSSLDTYSEHLIQAALETLMKGRTTLAIAHRLSTILAADVILVVNKGEIVEHGRHTELLALEGLYAQLYREQFAVPSDTGTTDTNLAAFLEPRTPNLQSLQALLANAASPTAPPQIPVASDEPLWPVTDLLPFVPDAFMPTYEDKLPAPNALVPTLTKPHLIVLSSISDEMREVFLEKDAITLGNANSNDIVLDRDSTVSPYHALLRKKDGDYYLFERRSHEGVFINREKLVVGVGGHKLTDGDQILIGQYHLIFSNPGAKNQTKQTARTSLSKRLRMPKMLTLPTKRVS
jgi:ATP-binding cassette, subfamily B, bacterial